MSFLEVQLVFCLSVLLLHNVLATCFRSIRGLWMLISMSLMRMTTLIVVVCLVSCSCCTCFTSLHYVKICFYLPSLLAQSTNWIKTFVQGIWLWSFASIDRTPKFRYHLYLFSFIKHNWKSFRWSVFYVLAWERQNLREIIPFFLSLPFAESQFWEKFIRGQSWCCFLVALAQIFLLKAQNFLSVLDS